MRNPNKNPPVPCVVKVGAGREYHFSFDQKPRAAAFCKGLRSHRSIKITDDLAAITCSKCRAKAISLGLIQGPKTLALYDQAIALASEYMAMGIEPTSSLKQAAADLGIPYGDEMGAFVAYANNPNA